MCARYALEREFECKLLDQPKRNILTKWYTSSLDDITDAKKGYIHIDDFETILKKFPTAFNHVKPLYRKIRGVFFLFYKDGALFNEISLDLPENLYHPIIEVFKDVIEGAKSRDKIVVGD